MGSSSSAPTRVILTEEEAKTVVHCEKQTAEDTVRKTDLRRRESTFS